MTRCTQCGQWAPEAITDASADHQPLESNKELRDLARVRDLAEAGYLVDLLENRGVRAEIRHEQRFDALTGAWSLAHVIQCAPDDLEAAAQALSAEAIEAEQEDRELVAERCAPHAVGWKSVALALAAGCSCFVLGQRFAEHSAPGAGVPRHTRLGHALIAIDRPFYTTPDARGRAFRLTPHERSGGWRLDADRDGDGAFETPILRGRLREANP